MNLRSGDKPHLLVIGATGQVGNALLPLLREIGTVVAAAQDGAGFVPVDLADAGGLAQLVRTVKPHAIINAAAYTAVDKAEQEEPLALQVNGMAPAVLADEAKRLGALLIHYSTDYVFDGTGTAARREDELTRPLNAYGRTKLAGEQAIAAVGGRSIVLRTSWVFSDHGHNFVKTMLKLGAERELLRVVADQTGAPTSAAFLARMTAAVIRQEVQGRQAASGVYHLTCGGETTWHGFAEAIFADAKSLGFPIKVREVQPIGTADYPVPAARPLNSRLDCSKFHRTFGTAAVSWQDELHGVLHLLQPEVAR